MRKARKYLAILLAVAMVFSMAPAMVFGGDQVEVARYGGNDRYETSALTALANFESADTVIIARGDDEGDFADGLAASYLAGVLNAPILLTKPDKLPASVGDAIGKLGASKAVILGGPAVVSDQVEKGLKDLDLKVERIFGDDRFATAAKIAAEGENADTAFVVSGFAPADSLVAGPLAFSNNFPVLLVDGVVPDVTSNAIAALGIKNIYVIGGTGVVSEGVYNKLAAIVGADKISRYGGINRIETSIEVAENLYSNPVNFSIVGYNGLPDAVGAAVFGNPILYVENDIFGIRSYLGSAVKTNSQFTIFGGIGVVSYAVENALKTLLTEPIGEVSTIKTSVVNAIPGLEGEETGISPDNVVVLGTTAQVKAIAVDKKGNPVSGADLTFTVTGKKALDDEEFTADAKFANGQTSVTATTNKQGEVTVGLNAEVYWEDWGYYWDKADLDSTWNWEQYKNYIANQWGAATEVSYTVAYKGAAVTHEDNVSFATLQQNQYTADNLWDMMWENWNSTEWDPCVIVEPNSPQSHGDNYVPSHTMTVYPFSQPDGQALAYGTRYAASERVSSAGRDNTLRVEAPHIGLSINSSKFKQDGQLGEPTKKLTYSIGNLQPNQTNVRTSNELVIPTNVNYATLTFKNLSLSPGSAVSVYFVPTDGDGKDGTAPKGAYTSNPAAYYGINGIELSPGYVNGDANWVKTFFAQPAENDDPNDYVGATPLVDSNFSVQIPTRDSGGRVYVVLQTPGQIEPETDKGYALESITMNYGSISEKAPFYDYAKLNDYLTWKTHELTYTNEQEMSSNEVAALLAADPQNNWGADPNWKYTYKVPVYPQVGNGVVKAYDGYDEVQMAWSVPSILGYGPLYETDNQNYLLLDNKNAIMPLAIDALDRSVGEIVSQNDGTAVIDSMQTGYTALKGELDLPYVPQDYLNTLASTYYAFAQWTPSPKAPTEPVNYLEPGDQQYTMVGQRVEIEAQLTDVNGNLVETAGVPITFYVSASGDSDVTATWDNELPDAKVNKNTTKSFPVNTDVNGIATITISAPDVAAAIVQASATGYNVALSDKAGALNGSAGLTQINFGKVTLRYVPEDTDFGSVTEDISMSKAVVGNTQNFGIKSKVEWPEQDFANVTNLKDPSGLKLYRNLAAAVAVKNIPFDVTSSGVGNVTGVKSITSTNENAADKDGNKKGITHWTAISTKAGEQDIKVAPLKTVWTELALEFDDAAIVNPGVGVPTGVNTLNIPVLWMGARPYAELTTPIYSLEPTNKEVPVTVRVADANGNPKAGVDVTFTLNSDNSVFKDPLDPTKPSTTVVTTVANGLATAYVVNGVKGDVDHVTISAKNTVDGTTIKFKDGTKTATQVIEWIQAQIPITSVAVTGTPQVDNVLTANVTPAEATVNYQWVISIDNGATYTNISGATGKTYTPVAADETKKIAVKVTGTGDYVGTAMSAFVGPVTGIPSP
jgi:putative cell wall-binding protein